MIALTRAMAQGEIAVLIVKDANPAFTLPAKAGFAEAIAKVPFVVSLSSHLDETTARAHLVVPDLTPLESWGDHSPREGVLGAHAAGHGSGAEDRAHQPGRARPPAAEGRARALGQKAPESFPGIDTKATGDLLLDTGRALVPGSEKSVFQAKTFADHLRESWRALAKSAAPKAPFETFWEEALRRGGYWADVPVAKVGAPAGRVGAEARRGGAGPRRAARAIPSSWSSPRRATTTAGAPTRSGSTRRRIR